MIREKLLPLLLSGGAFLCCAQQGMKTVPQGQTWSAAVRQQFWFQDQGSKLMPYKWFLNLECPDTSALACPAGTKLIDSLANYGFIPAPVPVGDSQYSAWQDVNPGNLPIGFARHVDMEGPDKAVPYVGLTCAACHSTRIEFPGQGALLIEGAPGKLDFDNFFEDVVASLRQTLNNPDRQKRFLNAVNEPDLLARFTDKVHALELRRNINAPAVQGGFGRVDAFGQIFNQILMAANAGTGQSPSQIGVLPPDAPSSYPFLWDISQHKFVQWNGSAPNLGDQGTGSFLRNVGEVLGVFGELSIHPSNPRPVLPQAPKYQSSAVVANLKAIEAWVSDLHSPQWPGAVADKASLDAGESIYRQECAGCHAVIDRETRRYPIRTHMVSVDDVQTDRQLVDNFRLRQGSAGVLAGQFMLTDPRFPLKRFEQRAYVRELTVNSSIGSYAAQVSANALKTVEDNLKELKEGAPDLSSYKARPLNGIWATPPYLHDGSVPNLTELLKRPHERASRFCVGSDVYDVKNVGYVSALPCGSRQFLFDTTLRGNGNSGHAYGTELTETDKANLMEYIKTL